MTDIAPTTLGELRSRLALLGWSPATFGYEADREQPRGMGEVLLREDPSGWLALVSERGRERPLGRFASESEAVSFLWDRYRHSPTTPQPHVALSPEQVEANRRESAARREAMLRRARGSGT